MKRNENEGKPSQPESVPVTLTEVDKRLAMLKAEVKFDYPELLERLESGTLQLVLFNSSKFGKNLHPDGLRRIGGLTILCRMYGAAVIFVDPDKVHEFIDA